MVGTSEQKTETTNRVWNAAEGWNQVLLDHTVIEIQSGFPCSRKYSVSDGLPHLRPFNIGTDGEINLGEIINIPKDYRGDLSHYELLPGDVLFNNTNSVELVGKTAIVHNPLRCAFSNHLTRLRIRDKARLEPAWLALCLRLLWRRGFFEQYCNKWIGQAGFNPTKLANVEIPLPHVDIQRRILARIEALMAELKRARTLLDQMLSVMNHIMEAALAQVFGHIRNGFEVTGIPPDQIRSISDVAKLERGKFTHRPRNDPQFFGGSVPWIQIQNLPGDYHKYITEYMNTLNDRGLAISKLFPKGTLVLSIAATIGALGILDFNACFPDSLVGITPNPSEIDLGFLYWQLLYIRRHLDTIAPAAAQKNINLQVLGQINLWKPSNQEQKRINIYLDELQANLDKMNELLDHDAKLLDRTEQSILDRAFRGEL